MVAVARTASHASRGWPADGRASMQVCASPGGEALASRTCPARAVWRPGSPARSGGSCRRRSFRPWRCRSSACRAPAPCAGRSAVGVGARRAAPCSAPPHPCCAGRPPSNPLPSPPLPSPPPRPLRTWREARQQRLVRRPAAPRGARARANLAVGTAAQKNSQFKAKSKMACDTPRTTEPSRPTRRTLEEREKKGGTARADLAMHSLADRN